MASKKDKGSTALAKRDTGGLQIAPWMQELGEKAKKDAAKFQTGVARISFKGGRITVDGQTLRDDSVNVVIVEAIFGKAYYDKGFKEGEAQVPSCYAFHPDDQTAMVPHEAAPDKQSEKCVGCPHNRFGTSINQDGSKGDGKRCKDEVRIMCALGTEVTDKKSILAGEFRMASIPPSSLKFWGKYIAKLRDMGITYDSVVTEIRATLEGGAFKLGFTPIAPITKEQHDALATKQESARTEMMQPYPALDGDKDKKPKARRAVKGQ